MSTPYVPPRLVAPCDARVRVPGSKSMAQRALVAAALSGGGVRVENAGRCDDVRAIERGLGALGFRLERSGEDLHVGARAAIDAGVVDVGESGTALRLLLSVAALLPGTFELTGRPGLLRRPIGELTRALTALGANLTDRDGFPPVRVTGGGLRGGRVQLDAGRSSQFASSLMLIAPDLPGGLEIELAGPPASPGYLELTRRVLASFGHEPRLEDEGIRVPERAWSPPDRYVVEGDWSAAGAFTLLAELCGGRTRPIGVDGSSGQPDRRFGAILAELRGSGDRRIDLGDLPDQTMNLAVAAALREGVTEIRGIAHLRIKESDRLAVTARELGRLGGEARVLEDGLRIAGGRPLHGGDIDPEGDHRMAMAFGVLGSFVDGVRIEDPGCVTKSFPGFFEELEAALGTRRCLALVGMRGAGKSTLGKALAESLGLEFHDTDRLFERRHGPIAAFVERRGWPAFRELEEDVLAACLAPGRVVATGGGAVESAANRQRLADGAFPIHLEATLDELRDRIAPNDPGRPALLGSDAREELGPLLARRAPLYRSVARLTVPPAEVPDRLAGVLENLRAPWPAGAEG